MAEKKEGNQQPGKKPGPREDEIRKRAYEIYRARNEGPGNELDDWLKAENEFKELRATTG